jgi:signal transduction histidine kinase
MAVMVGVVAWALAGAAVACAFMSARALSARSEAVARACHELRGPLTAARLGLQLLHRMEAMPAATLRAIELELSRAGLALDDLARAGAGGDGGLGTVRGLSALATRGSAPPAAVRDARELVDVEALLADCIEAARAPGAAAGVPMLRLGWVGGVGHVWADRVRLAQAVGNLIANAIEHGGGEIEVRGRAEAGTVRIEVLDTGRGLPAPVAELARRPRGGRGTRGRGLAIASAIATDHGGRLAAAPSDRGARLVLELPMAAGEAPAEGGGG